MRYGWCWRLWRTLPLLSSLPRLYAPSRVPLPLYRGRTTINALLTSLRRYRSSSGFFALWPLPVRKLLTSSTPPTFSHLLGLARPSFFVFFCFFVSGFFPLRSRPLRFPPLPTWAHGTGPRPWKFLDPPTRGHCRSTAPPALGGRVRVVCHVPLGLPAQPPPRFSGGPCSFSSSSPSSLLFSVSACKPHTTLPHLCTRSLARSHRRKRAKSTVAFFIFFILP